MLMLVVSYFQYVWDKESLDKESLDKESLDKESL